MLKLSNLRKDLIPKSQLPSSSFEAVSAEVKSRTISLTSNEKLLLESDLSKFEAFLEDHKLKFIDKNASKDRLLFELEGHISFLVEIKNKISDWDRKKYPLANQFEKSPSQTPVSIENKNPFGIIRLLVVLGIVSMIPKAIELIKNIYYLLEIVRSSASECLASHFEPELLLLLFRFPLPLLCSVLPRKALSPRKNFPCFEQHHIGCHCFGLGNLLFHHQRFRKRASAYLYQMRDQPVLSLPLCTASNGSASFRSPT